MSRSRIFGLIYQRRAIRKRRQHRETRSTPLPEGPIEVFHRELSNWFKEADGPPREDGLPRACATVQLGLHTPFGEMQRTHTEVFGTYLMTREMDGLDEPPEPLYATPYDDEVIAYRYAYPPQMASAEEADAPVITDEMRESMRALQRLHTLQRTPFDSIHEPRIQPPPRVSTDASRIEAGIDAVRNSIIERQLREAQGVIDTEGLSLLRTRLTLYPYHVRSLLYPLYRARLRTVASLDAYVQCYSTLGVTLAVFGMMLSNMPTVLIAAGFAVVSFSASLLRYWIVRFQLGL